MTADSMQRADALPYDDKPAPRSKNRWRALLDWLDSTDPGLMRLRMATEVVVAIGIVVAAEWIFVRATGALQTPIPAHAPAALAAELWTLNHALLVIGIMLGAILAMISGFGISMYANARSQLVTLLFLPLPLLAMLAVGLSVHVRVASLALLAITLAIGTYCRRFGPRGFMGGMLAFMGVFLGFFIQDYIKMSQFGWLAAEIALGAAVTIVVHFALFRPRPEVAVRRMQRSYTVRARDLASDIAELFEARVRSGKTKDSNQRADRQLQRQLLQAQRDRPAHRRAAEHPGRDPGRLERGHPAPAPVRRRGGAWQRRPVRDGDRRRRLPGAGHRAGLRRPRRHPRRRLRRGPRRDRGCAPDSRRP